MPLFTIYFILFIVCTLYAVFLQRIHDLYTPDHIWLTVVGGNVLIGMALLALCLFGILPLAAFWHLLALNVVAGIPIIVWQFWQAGQRNGARHRPR
jgi:hypothetical protein